MEITISNNGKDINLSATGGVLIRYKRQYKSDYIADFMEINKADEPSKQMEQTLITGSKLIWAMAATADKSIGTPGQFYSNNPNIDINNDEFNASDFLKLLKIANDLFCESIGGEAGDNKGGQQMTAENLIACATLCGLTVDDVDQLPISMITETIKNYCEMKYGKDEKTSGGLRIATADDWDNFLN